MTYDTSFVQGLDCCFVLSLECRHWPSLELVCWWRPFLLFFSLLAIPLLSAVIYALFDDIGVVHGPINFDMICFLIPYQSIDSSLCVIIVLKVVTSAEAAPEWESTLVRIFTRWRVVNL